MVQLPRLLDRLDEIGLRRVDGEVLWSRVVTNQTPQDQVGLQVFPDFDMPPRAREVQDLNVVQS